MRDLIFYTVAGTIIGFIAQLIWNNFAVTMFTSLLIPPALILTYRIIRMV